jgi:hypothetical protein
MSAKQETSSMAKRKSNRSSRTASRKSPAATPVLEDLARRSLALGRQQAQQRSDEKNSTEREMAQHFGQARGSPEARAATPQARRAQDALRKLHDKLAKQKVSVAKLAPGIAGVFPSAVSVTVVPPFDYDIIIPGRLAGTEATIEGSSSKNTGRMELSAVTATEDGFGGGSMYTTVGLYFHPPGPGTLTVRAAPTYSFQWWTNSLRPTAIVQSFGSLGITIYGVDLAHQTIGETGTIIDVAGTSLFRWDETRVDELHFDFGFGLQASGSVQLEVRRSLVYLMFVDADVHAHGFGRSGSLAGAKLSVAVPSITYDFKAQQVLSPT